MGGARVQGIVCWWFDISNCLGYNVIVVLGSSSESVFGYLRQGGLGLFLHPLLHHVSLRSIPLHSVCCWWT